VKLSNLRNPLPNIKKAYSPNFSNATNESSDEKGAAEMNEWIMPLLRLLVKGAGMVGRGARGVGKVVGPLAIPGATDAVFDIDDTADAPTLDDPTEYGQRWYDGEGDGIERDLDFGPDQAVPPTSTPAPPPPPTRPPTGPGSHPYHH